jgi:hypothetical protein
MYPNPDPKCEPSEEQMVIMRDFEQGYNIKVSAVAGAGKSTLLLQLGRILAHQNKKGLIVTYNKHLESDLSLRVQAMGLDSVLMVKTIHSAFNYIFKLQNGTHVSNDIGIHNYIQQGILNNIPKSPLQMYSAILVDEVQDLNEAYYQFLISIINNKQFVIVGDCKQCINQFNGSTTKFFEHHTTYFKNNREWKEQRMITSYRLTPKIAQFIEATFGNNGIRHIIGGNLKSHNEAPVYIANSYETELIEDILMWAIDHYGVDNVAILTQSVDSIASKSPLDIILNGSNGPSQLTRRQITPVFRGSRDHGGRNKRDQYEAGKLLISTFNSMKGSEKEATFVFLSDYYRKKWNPDAIYEIGNIPYVAYTRARELLVIIQGSDPLDGPIQPLRSKQVERLCNFSHRATSIPFPKLKSDNNNLFTHKRSISKSVTEIVTHRCTTDLLQLLSFLEIIPLTSLNPIDVSDCIDIDYTYTKQNKTTRGKTPVLKYYGIAITLLAEQQRMNALGYSHQVYTSRLLTFMKNYYKRRIPGSDDTGALIYYEMLEIIRKQRFPMVKDPHLLEKDPIKGYQLANILMSEYFKPGADLKDDLLSVIEHDIYQKYQQNDTIRLIMTTEMYNDRISEYYALRDFKWFRMDVLQKLTDSLNNYLGPEPDELYEIPLNGELIHPYLKYTRPTNSEYDLGTPTIFYLDPDITTEALNFFQSSQIHSDYLVTQEPWKFWYTYINIEGRIDIIKNEIPIEVKCHTLDDNEALLQLATYLALSPYNKGILINLVTGTLNEITLTKKIPFLSVLTHTIKNWETIDTLQLNTQLAPPSLTSKSNQLSSQFKQLDIKDAPPIASNSKGVPTIISPIPSKSREVPQISVVGSTGDLLREIPTVEELMIWPKYKLQLYCKELGLKGYTKKDIRIDDLIILIENYRSGIVIEDYESMTTKQLIELCKQFDIKNYSKLKKHEMIHELKKINS